MNRKKRNTVILIIALLVVAGIVYAVPRITAEIKKEQSTENAKKYAVIQSYNEEPIELDLSENQELRIGSESAYNIIEVKDGTVCVKEADCPDQICVAQGEIHESYGVIACLPHQLIITVKEENSENAKEEIDSAAW